MTDSMAVAVHDAPRTTALLRPVVTAAAMVEAHKEVAELITKALQKDVDYGVIPGTGKKPTLLKPGAERLVKAFGCVAVYDIVEKEIDHDRPVPWAKRQKKWRNAHAGDKMFDWIEETGTSLGLYRYVVKCSLISQAGQEVGQGIGACSTMESKYVDRPRDCENTALKMAQKRALVAAALNAFGLSDRFTQDVEDQRGEDEPGRREPPSEPKPAGPIVLPGEAGKSWGGHAGKPIPEVPPSALKAFVKWCEGDGERLAKFAAVVVACKARIQDLVTAIEVDGDAKEPAA